MLNNVLSLLCLLYVLMWNLREYNPQEYTRFMPHRFDWVRDVFWFGQRWDMFAPRPMTFDGWHVIPARLHDGREVDLFSGGKAVTWEKPQRVSRMYANTRWRKYHLNIQFTWNSEHRGWYARYLARTWNAAHPDPGDQVESIEIDFMQQDTTPDGVRPTPRKLVLWKYSVAQ